MKVFVLIALILASTMAVQMRRPMSTSQIQKFENMKKTDQWAGIMMNLAELHIQAQGPLDDLVEAIEDVVEDLHMKVERAHDEYDKKSEQHEAEVARINGQIDSANADIAHTTEFLKTVLYVQKANLELDLQNLATSIANTRQYMDEQAELRNQEHLRFNQAIEEHEEALAAVWEALDVLSQLSDGTSLLQVKRAKKSLEKVQNSINKNVEGSLVKALLALTSGEFANSESLQKVADLLNEVATNLTASVAKFTEEEEMAQADFEMDMKQKEADLNRMAMEVTEKTEQLEQTNASIADNEEFLELRKRDLAGYQEDLETENENFERITELYEQLVEQLNIELRACSEALDVLNNSDIAGYIGGRMEQDVVIDQPHGMGIVVEDKFDEFQG